METPRRAFFPLSIPGEGLAEVVSRSQPTKPETLPDYVRRVRDGRPFSELEENSARRGQRISGSYINRIENGVQRKPSGDRLVALAHALGVPVAELMAIASGKPMVKVDARRERLLKSFDSLPEDRQEDILEQLAALEKKYARRRVA